MGKTKRDNITAQRPHPHEESHLLKPGTEYQYIQKPFAELLLAPGINSWLEKTFFPVMDWQLVSGVSLHDVVVSSQ